MRRSWQLKLKHSRRESVENVCSLGRSSSTDPVNDHHKPIQRLGQAADAHLDRHTAGAHVCEFGHCSEVPHKVALL